MVKMALPGSFSCLVQTMGPPSGPVAIGTHLHTVYRTCYLHKVHFLYFPETALPNVHAGQ